VSVSYRSQNLRELSLEAFALERCEGDGCRKLVHRDDIDRRDDGGYCTNCRDEQFAEAYAAHAWMIPHVARETAARRAGDIDTAEQIKRDVLRYDSPLDPMNRGAL
jgi:hypothetical protein